MPIPFVLVVTYFDGNFLAKLRGGKSLSGSQIISFWPLKIELVQFSPMPVGKPNVRSEAQNISNTVNFIYGLHAHGQQKSTNLLPCCFQNSEFCVAFFQWPKPWERHRISNLLSHRWFGRPSHLAPRLNGAFGNVRRQFLVRATTDSGPALFLRDANKMYCQQSTQLIKSQNQISGDAEK